MGQVCPCCKRYKNDKFLREIKQLYLNNSDIQDNINPPPQYSSPKKFSSPPEYTPPLTFTQNNSINCRTNIIQSKLLDNAVF